MFNKLKWILAKGLKIVMNPPAIHHCEISPKAKVCARSELTGCRLGPYSYVGYQCFMVNTEIGSFCSIADRCSIGGAAHPMDFVSTSPVFHEGKNLLKTSFSAHAIPQTPKTTIGHDVWIGQGAFIKAGVTVSVGAVIGMGTVVTHDVGPYEIWAGNPAKLIRRRFSQETIDGLLASRWWEMDEESLQKAAADFDDPQRFLKNLSDNGREDTL